MWALVNPSRSHAAIWKAGEPLLSFGKEQQKPWDNQEAAGPLVGFGKAWHKTWGSLEGSRAHCRLWQMLGKEPGPSGRQQGPFWVSARCSKRPGALCNSKMARKVHSPSDGGALKGLPREGEGQEQLAVLAPSVWEQSLDTFGAWLWLE